MPASQRRLSRVAPRPLEVSERDVLAQWLGSAAWRLRLDLCLREAAATVCWLLCATVLYQAIRVLLGVHEVLAALLPLFLLCGAALIVLFAWRLSQRPTLQQAAAAADRRANLRDQLGTALWVAQQRPRSPMIELLLERAIQTVQHLEARRLFPVGAPRSLPLAVALMLLAAALACLSPRVAVTQIPMAQAGLNASPDAKGRMPPADEDQAADLRPDERATAVELDRLVRQLAADSSPEAIAQAVGARDARGAAQLLEAIQRLQGSQAGTGRAAHPQGEQMSDALAQGILDRLKELSGESAATQPAQPIADADRSTARLQRELREELEDVQRSRPGEQSAGEDALNTMLRAMSRNSTGGRDLVRGETEPIRDAGRTSVGGGGAMGRRVGVSQAGGGNGEQPRSNPDEDDTGEPVPGQKTQRLAVQLQTVKVEQRDDDERNGAEEAFYAATQAQSSKLEYEAVTARSRRGSEQATGSEHMPLAYRDSARQYTLSQHQREPREPEQ
jgi:hypothetical protein